jgi:enoyl-CoA hydratase
MVSAEEAKTLGLVNQVYLTREEMMNGALALLKKVVHKSPIAVAHIIKSVNSGFGFEDAGYEEEALSFGKCAETEDFREGTAAFLEKRKPVFKGL